ncbi:hypothetical protein [Croceicoccus sp. BE223]|uniref:hypothetical protein n=1 Tax=Croceicoccus sp. BE223 TaxID=2817716 RepID=UPI002861ACCC|nr:hypothetical protein [Croceicoccus sp. BE223]MDR7101471.1 hypothetical protein [Croceicoccus sp. BE223]
MVIGLAYLAIAFVIFDRVLASLRADLFVRYLKFWCLAVAAGLFGLGRLTGTELFYDLAHPCLIAYAALRIHAVAAGNPSRWWRID